MKINDDIYYVGVFNAKERVFEGVIPTPKGMNYNSYLILDEKTALMDTVDVSVTQPFLKNVHETLQGRPLDYLVIHHVEPDHTSGIKEIIRIYPSVTLVISALGLKLLHQFLVIFPETSIQVVKENDTLALGKHILHFISAPMVHWPEVIMSFDSGSGTLFSADAFGAFGAISEEEIFAHQHHYGRECLPEARRYYTNIVGKYGESVTNLLAKVRPLPIQMIAPLHGHIFTENIQDIVSYYEKWSSYTAESEGVLIISCSIYGHTQMVADSLFQSLKSDLIPVEAVNLNVTSVSEALSLTFKYSHIVLLSPTFNMGLFTPMENYLLDFKAHNIKHKTFTLVENGSWAPQAARLMKEIINSMGNNTINDKVFTITSAVKDIDKLVSDIKKEVIHTPEVVEIELPVIHQWKCKICGYIYEGVELPHDFHCPLCGHPASDFVLIK